MNGAPEVFVIGAGIVDVLVSGVDSSVFERGSTPAGGVSMQTGGDGLNEAMIISMLGRSAGLVSCVGSDDAGGVVLEACRRAGVDARFVVKHDGMPTGVNIVLIDDAGERRFITDPNGSLRKLPPEDVLAAIDDPAFAGAKIAAFASIFVCPLLTPVLEAIFSRIRERGLILCADMTKRKNGETVEDIRGALSHVDYIFPNHEEAVLVTGETEPERIARRFMDCGVKNVAIKLGGRGCYIANDRIGRIIPAVPGIRAVDTTGAGDNFAAGFMAALCENMDFEECARYANAVASLCVENIGASSGSRDRTEIMRRMEMIRRAEANDR